MIARVLINRNIDSLNREFSYLIPKEMNAFVGARVVVPFGRGNSKIIGIIVEICDEDDSDIELKPILEILDEEPLITQKDIDTASFISEKTFSNKIESLKLFLPPMDLNSIQKDLYSTRTLELVDESKFGHEKIREKLDSGEFKYSYSLKNQPSMYTKKILYAKNEVDDLSEKQMSVYNIIKSGNYSRSDIMKRLSISDSPIKTLIKNGYIGERVVVQKFIGKEVSQYKKHQLNEIQRNVVDGIFKDYKSANNKFLINGVTGSGKTEVYLQIVEEVLKDNKSAIILVPEIGLTPQTVARFKGRFNEEVAIIHSKLTQKERYDQWMRIKNGDIRIVVGARSAIFSPVQNLGIIIIDEEHDNSYISSHTPKYKTVDIAEFMADINNAMMILGSATPSLDSYYKASKGIYRLYEMNERANGKSLPKIEVADMALELNNGNTSIFSLKLYEAILDNLKNKKQTMLFLNRRGYSGFVSCRTCGEAIKCEDCDVSMTYHKNMNRLVCHYCGKSIALPEKCPNCGSDKIKDFGIGTEQVEYITKKLFPHARVERMDRDTMSKKNSHYDIYQRMNSGDIDILIGTQMIAKGLDFKNVTLVGIIAADMLLKIPDYRACEWMYSLVRQVSGRAGRGEDEGRVILQTYQPEHFAIKLSVNGEYEEFFKTEMKVRKEFLYPPFTKIILVQKNSTDNMIAHNDLMDVYHKLTKFVIDNDITAKVLHPNPSPIAKIKNEYRWQFIIKSPDKNVSKIIEFLKNFNSKEINVSVDPISMM